MPDPSARPALMREVRLGLVCYGGVSLAIYMHGVTKELYKLIRAARAFERAYDTLGGQVPADQDPGVWLNGPGTDSERAYFAALAALAARGTPLTVTLDIVAGTSAGGITIWDALIFPVLSLARLPQLHRRPPLRRVLRPGPAGERLPVGQAGRRRADHAPAQSSFGRAPARHRPGRLRRAAAGRADRDPGH
jgi:hypothetical protein